MFDRVLRGVAAALLAYAPMASADDANAAHDLFAEPASLEFVLEAPFWEIAHDRDPDPKDRAAALVWKNADGADVRIPLEVKPRGKSRRNAKACKFPPLRLNFPKGAAAATPFAGLDKIKLVTHCGRLGDTDAVFGNRVRLEYLLYRVFERISPTSLRVRAVDVTYADTDRGGKHSTHPGFLIEPEAALAARLELRKVDVEAIGLEELEADQASRVEMFEYLAGNTDFSMTLGPPHDKCCHNIVPLAASDGRVLPVPYDFDATGIVGAPYARPSDRLSIRSVRRRLWRGYCRDPEHLQASARVFRDAQTDIYALFRQDARLDPKTIEKTTAYLDEFYAVLGDSAAFDRLITSRCLVR